MTAKILLPIFFIFSFFCEGYAQMKIGDNTTTVNSSSVLELETTNKGLLFPRISLPSTTSWSLAGTNKAQGMVVFNTNTATTGGSGTGLYYWDNNSWNAVNINRATDLTQDLINLEDFIYGADKNVGSQDNLYGFAPFQSGTGSSSLLEPVTAQTTMDYTGAYTFTTGTSATGSASLYSFNSVNKLPMGGLAIVYEIRARIDNNISTSGDSFFANFGLVDGSSTTSDTRGVYFSYNLSESPNWIAKTMVGGVPTPINSGIAVAASKWYKLKAIINTDATLIDFYIDNVWIGSSSTNIPKGVSNMMKFVFKIQKTAGSADRQCSVDYITWRAVR